MNTFLKSCRRCLNPWVVGLIILVIVGLIYFVPIIGFATLIAFLPLVGCAVMCGGMMFFMKKGHKEDK